jgi:hypothetical protein
VLIVDPTEAPAAINRSPVEDKSEPTQASGSADAAAPSAAAPKQQQRRKRKRA